VLPGLPDLSRRERGVLEYDLLGLTVQDHPTRIFPAPADERIARAFPHLAPDAVDDRRARGLGGGGPVNPVRCAEVRELPGGRVTLRGWLVASRRVHTRDDRWMRFLTLEDESGLAEVVLWPDVYARDGHRLSEPGVLVLTGTVQDQLGARTLQADRIW
jgi:DNA polymerase III alpha subunit